MSPRILRTFAALAAAVFLNALSARAGHDEEEGDPAFDQVDTNGDGRLSSAESGAGARRLFALADTNHDGFLTAAEIDAQQAQRKDAAIRFSSRETDGVSRDPGSGAARADGSVPAHEVATARGAALADRDTPARIRLSDRDGDGRLNAAEFEAAAARAFRRLDTDGDGSLSRAECAAESDPVRENL